MTLENVRHRLPSGTIGEGAVDQNDSLDGRVRRKWGSQSGAHEESQNQAFHGAAPLMLATDVAGAEQSAWQKADRLADVSLSPLYPSLHSPSSPSPLRIRMAGVGHDRSQDWIVGVALLRSAIERLAIERAKRHIEIKPGHKVRVADEGLAKRDEIGAPLRDGLVGVHFVEAVIGHEEPAKEPLDRQIVKRRNGGPTRVALDHMKISEASTRQRSGDVVEQALRIAVSDVVLPVLRRDAQAGALGTNRSGHRVDDLEQKPHTVLDAASISVRALVGTVAQELIDQISVRAMYLDTLEAGRKRVPRSLRKLRDDAGDLGCLKRAWRGDLLEAVCREGFCVRPNGGWCDRQSTAGLEGGMGDAPDVPELEHHAAATGIDCTGHAFPAFDLLGAVDTRRADIALALGRDLSCFRDDESGASPLGVIQRAQRGGHVAGARTASSQGRHDNTVRQRERSYFDGGEEIPRGFSGELLHEAILLRRGDVNGTTPPIATSDLQPSGLPICYICNLSSVIGRSRTRFPVAW